MQMGVVIWIEHGEQSSPSFDDDMVMCLMSMYLASPLSSTTFFYSLKVTPRHDTQCLKLWNELVMHNFRCIFHANTNVDTLHFQNPK